MQSNFCAECNIFLCREIWLIWHYFLPKGIPFTPLEYLIFVKNHLLPLRMDKKMQVLWLDFEISPTGVLVWTLDRQRAARFCRLGILETDPGVDVGQVGANLASCSLVSLLFASWANKMWASHDASKPPLSVTKATSLSSQMDRLTLPSKLGVQRKLYSIVSIRCFCGHHKRSN